MHFAKSTLQAVDDLERVNIPRHGKVPCLARKMLLLIILIVVQFMVLWRASIKFDIKKKR